MSKPAPTAAVMHRDSSAPRMSHNLRNRILLLGLTVLLWGNLCRALGNEWSFNEQYNYGWFVPFFAAYLFWLRWQKRPSPAPPSARALRFGIAVALPALVLLLPIRLLEVGNPDWRIIGWVHTCLVVGLTFLVIWNRGGKPWTKYFAFPILFFLVAVPWPLTFEVPVIQGLMRLVASIAAETLALLGIPTQLEGSLIRVNTGLVGVNEACSGVRSLQTSLMIGLLFGELRQLSATRRIILILGALVIALVGNFARTCFLVWLAATRNIAATTGWHDIAGYSIVGAVFVGTLCLSRWLSGPRSGGTSEPAMSKAEQTSSIAATQSPSPPKESHSFPFPTAAISATICWLLAVEVSVEAWYRIHESTRRPAVRWSESWPQDAPGFHEVVIDEEVQRILRCDRGREASWSALDLGGSAAPAHWIMFFFRWEPAMSSIQRGRAHRPDLCLPHTGWRQVGDTSIRDYSITEKFPLTFRRFSFVRRLPNQPELYAHAFFCVGEDTVGENNKNIGGFDLESQVAGILGRRGFVKAVLQGLRNPGQQVLEVILITSHPIPPNEAEARFTQLVPSLVRVQRDTEQSPSSAY